MKSHRHIRWTRETAIAALRALKERLGRVPRADDMMRPDALCPWTRTIWRMFGSFRAYQRAAGFRPTKRGRLRSILCKSRRHRMTVENTILEPRPCKRQRKPTIVRRCRSCKTERLRTYPSTVAGREARRRENLARRQQRKARATSLAFRIREHWARGDTTSFLRFAS